MIRFGGLDVSNRFLSIAKRQNDVQVLQLHGRLSFLEADSLSY